MELLRELLTDEGLCLECRSPSGFSLPSECNLIFMILSATVSALYASLVTSPRKAMVFKAWNWILISGRQIFLQMLRQFVNSRGPPKCKKLHPIPCRARAVSYQSFQIFAKIWFYLVTSWLNIFIKFQIETIILKQKTFLTLGRFSTEKNSGPCHQFHVQNGKYTEIPVPQYTSLH